MTEMKNVLATWALGAMCLFSGSTARTLTVLEDSASLPSGLSGATSKPCFTKLYASRSLSHFMPLPELPRDNCTVCVYPSIQTHISDLYSLSQAIHSAQAFTCGSGPAGPLNAEAVEAAKALVKTTAEAFTINACQVSDGAAAVCVSNPGFETVVHQVVKAFVETDSYYGFTQGWSVALPCEDACDVNTELAMDSIQSILEAAATEAYMSICPGTSGTWSVPQLSQYMEGVALQPLAHALTQAVVAVPEALCPAVQLTT